MGLSSNDLTLKVGFDIDKFAAELGKVNGKLDSWAGGVTRSITGLGKAFTALAIGKFALDVSKLAGEAQGVKEAFDRLPSSINLMNDLKAATHGTVSELDLMKRSVMASNFDIGLKELPKLLEFATLRAKQTGQSVDYLVDSIVTGIGRKSKLILDNLGISAVQLTEALGGASAASSSIAEVTTAVGKIIEKNLPMMGQLSENASTKVDRLSASWTNFKIAIGNAANGTGFFGKILDGLSGAMDFLANENISLADKFQALINPAAAAKITLEAAAIAAKKLADETKGEADAISTARYFLDLYSNDLKKVAEAVKGAADASRVMRAATKLIADDAKKESEAIRNEKNLTAQLSTLRDDATLAVGRERAAINQQIQAIEKEISALQKLGIEKEKGFKGVPFFGVQGDKLKSGVDPKKDMAKNMKWWATFEKADNILLDERIKKVKEAKDSFNEFGISTQNGLAQADKAFSLFLKNGKLDEFNDKLAQIKNTEMQVRQSMSNFGDALGTAFGNVIEGTQTLAQAFSAMAIDVISSIERIVMANMVASASKYGLAGILFAAAGFGIVKALFAKIGGNKATSSIGGSRGLSNSYHQNTSSGNRELVAQVTGRQINFILKETGRGDSRTSTTG